MKSEARKLWFAVAGALLAIATVSCTQSGQTPSTAAVPPPSSSGPPTTVGSTPVPLFTGADLSGWHQAGGGNWSVDNGQIVGRSQNDTGGWLFLNDSYQDFVLDLSFQCESNCSSGILLRGSKDDKGVSGIYIPLGGADMGKMYRVHVNGSDYTLSPLKAMPGPNPPGPAGDLAVGPCSPVPCSGIRGAHGGGLAVPSTVPPNVQLHPGWNAVSVTMRGDVIFATVNGVRLASAQMDNAPLYGQIALRTAGSSGSAVQFKNITLYDLTLRAAGVAKPYTDPNFRKQQLNDEFYSEGISAGDINHDGHIDVVAGPFYFIGPDFTQAREIYPPETPAIASSQSGLPEKPGIPGMGQLPDKNAPPVPQAGAIVHGSYSPTFMSWVYDFNGDGWPDVLVIMGFGPRPTFSAHLFINPRGEKRSWDNYEVFPVISNEVDNFLDIDGDGRPELVIQTAKDSTWADSRVGYLKPDWSDPTKPWQFTPISTPGRWGGHGSGVGDINGDGRLDILTSEGWWERPPAGTTGLWKYHQQRFGHAGTNCGPGCGGSEISVYDVNGDGLPDVITSLAAHGPGLGWFEQQRDAQGNITWKPHLIMGDPNTPMSQRGDWEETDKSVAFTELHALAYPDMNGDGLKDIVTGKRWFSHGFVYEENEVDDPPVVYWFELQRKAGGQVQWVPHMIDNRSGVGTQIVATDVNGSGRPDVLTSARKGTFIFFNNLPKH
jgi:Domain of Unknown Function (DUF1080)/FG-GAP-like repeat